MQAYRDGRRRSTMTSRRPGVRLAIVSTLAVLSGSCRLAPTTPVNSPPELRNASAVATPDNAPNNRDHWECRFADGRVTIDGKADEPAWRSAQVIDGFHVPWASTAPARKPRTATRARLLWDEHHLYFFAEMEDRDLYADITEHQGEIWYNDVFELFFKPADDKRGYYEFEVSPANTTLELAIPARGAGGYPRFKRTTRVEMETAVSLGGTLNRWQDRDRGWSVEGRLAWRDLAQTGGAPEAGDTWKFNLCRYDYSVEYETPELTCLAPLTRPDFHQYERFIPLRFTGLP